MIHKNFAKFENIKEIIYPPFSRSPGSKFAPTRQFPVGDVTLIPAWGYPLTP